MSNSTEVHDTETCEADQGQPCAMCKFATEQEARSASEAMTQTALVSIATVRAVLFDTLDEGDHHWPWTFPLSETQTATDARVRFVDAVEARVRRAAAVRS